MSWLITRLQQAWGISSDADDDDGDEGKGEAASAKPEAAAEAERVEGKARVLALVDSELTRCERELSRLQEREGKEARARLDAAVLPSVDTVHTILRYEAMLERQFYRAMNQLERLQRARRGEMIPPPLTMEVSGG